MIIDLYTLGLFALSAAVLTLIPGADMLCALSSAVSQGTKAGLLTVLGAATGVICHVCFVIAGVTALIASSSLLYHLFVIGGAMYIMWVGLRIYTKTNSINLTNHGERKSSKMLFLQGLLTNLLNPKAIIFMLAFIPQFIRVETGWPGIQMLILGIELIIIMLLIEIPLVYMAGKLALSITRHPAIGIYVNKLFGGIIFSLATVILAERLFISANGLMLLTPAISLLNAFFM